MIIFIIFQETKSKVMSTLFNDYLSTDIFKSDQSGLEKVCSSNDRLAYMASDRAIKIAQHKYNCTYQRLDTILTQNVALPISKNNPFREALNRLLVF